MNLLRYKGNVTEEEFHIFSQILSKTANSIILTDIDGSILYVNNGFENLTGFKRKELIGKNARIIQSGKTKISTYKKMWETIFKGKTWKGIFCNKKKNGELFWGKTIIFPILNKQGKITHFVGIQTDITEERKATEKLLISEAKLKLLSITDELTGIFNLRHFKEQLEAEINKINRYGGSLAIISFDIDNFKIFNDQYGHATGDLVLKKISALAREELRDTDSFYRIGGEEFSIILPFSSLSQAIFVAEKIRKTCQNSTVIDESNVTISVGVTQYKEKDTIRSFTKRADDLMYKAKKSGKNKTCF